MIKVSKVLVKQPIKKVWGIVTNPQKFHGLKLPGTYSSFQSGNISKGVPFKYKGLAFNIKRDLYVVEWEPPHKFSFGEHPNYWSFKFELIDGGQSTELHFYRELRDRSFFEKIMLLFGKEDEYQELTNATTEAIKDACERLLRGEEDGIFYHEWEYEN